jgi:hypothetical protein
MLLSRTIRIVIAFADARHRVTLSRCCSVSALVDRSQVSGIKAKDRVFPRYHAMKLNLVIIHVNYIVGYALTQSHRSYSPLPTTQTYFAGQNRSLSSSRIGVTLQSTHDLSGFSLFSYHPSVRPQEEVPVVMDQAIQRFFFHRDHGPLSITLTIIVMIVYRIHLHQQHLSVLTVHDFLAFSLSIIFWWFQEHFIHQKLLHSKYNWYGKTIHEEHHSKPYFHISIDPPALMLGWILTTFGLVRIVAPLSISLSVIIGYTMAGLCYEFIHYLVHTRVKMNNRYFQSVRDLHIRHHLVSDENYFSFQIPMIDDIMRTNPPVSEVKQKNKLIKRRLVE